MYIRAGTDQVTIMANYEKEKFGRELKYISINLLVFYHEWGALIGYATHYLFDK